ncbi:MAG: efflux RND transporter periplasmic adaptor subunit [Burkholderiales bacterium]|nr:efflux RND transporter periplasmic adaptor subunit [Burkholderiales bacterium]
MTRTHPARAALAAAAALLAAALHAQDKPAAKADARAAAKPALTVTLVQPQARELPLALAANGTVAAWQEAVLGAEVNGLRLAEVRAEVGDRVRRGQVLAVFNADTVAADLAQAKAALAEAEATLAEARANAARAQSIAGSGALSAQQVAQYATAEATAQARLEQARAQERAQTLRLAHTRVTASDDGVISARSATLGAVAGPGQELFRLIRKARLEWRGEVTAAELHRLKPGLPVRVSTPGGAVVEGRVRTVAPTVDATTRSAIVYVDLPQAMDKGLKPGMFARGEFVLGAAPGLTLPQDAVVLRDGFAWAYRAGPVANGQARVTRVKVETGRRVDDRVEVRSGLAAADRVVASGAAFLADGDTVKVAP